MCMDVGAEQLLVAIEPILDEDGKPAAALITWKSITADLEWERQLALNNELAAQQAGKLEALINQIRTVVHAASKGDLRQTIDRPTDPSLTAIAETINSFLAELNRDFRELRLHADELLSCTTQLTNNSVRIERSAADLSERCTRILQNTESVNGLISTAAATTEQLTALINEISLTTANADKVAREAVMPAKNTSDTIWQLYTSSSDIGSVLKIITSIAEQTNLLALNAPSRLPGLVMRVRGLPW